MWLMDHSNSVFLKTLESKQAHMSIDAAYRGTTTIYISRQSADLSEFSRDSKDLFAFRLHADDMLPLRRPSSTRLTCIAHTRRISELSSEMCFTFLSTLLEYRNITFLNRACPQRSLLLLRYLRVRALYQVERRALTRHPSPSPFKAV